MSHLQLLAKIMAGEEIAREIIATISTQYGIASNLVVAVMHDRVVCNGGCSSMNVEDCLSPTRGCWVFFTYTRFSR